MGRIRVTRRGFLRDSAGVATVGLAACSGGAAVGGSPVTTGGENAAHLSTAAPTAASATATPSATGTATRASFSPRVDYK